MRRSAPVRPPIRHRLVALGAAVLVLAALVVVGRALLGPILPDGQPPALPEPPHWPMILPNLMVLLLGASWVLLMLRRRS